jgi:hypothetical protein
MGTEYIVLQTVQVAADIIVVAFQFPAPSPEPL